MRVSIRKAGVVLAALLSYVLYIVLINVEWHDYKSGIYVMSVLGWVIWLYIVITWKKETNQVFSLYIIYISFAILFTYGQCLMWALGIHGKAEIINRVIEGRVRLLDSDIFQAQLLTLTGLLSFHAGAICQNKPVASDSHWLQHDRSSTALSSICRILLVFSTICIYYYWLRNVLIYRSFGYGSYQYGDTSGNISSIIVIGSWLFIPSIIGLLVSEQYSKTSRTICYTLFLGYVLLCVMAGDRGWIYELVVLVWLHFRMQDQINVKRIVKLGIVGLLILMFAESISKVRQSGLSIDAILNSIKNDNPISSAFFEMGGTMAPTAIIFHDPNFKYPFGNSYLLAIPEMITTRFITFFVPDYQGIGGWFSHTYLGLSYGAGFSLVAEALANYGKYFAPLWLVFLGFLIGRVVTIKPEEKNEITIFFKSTTCLALLFLVRNTTVNSLKRWFFSTIVILLMVTILTKGRKRYRSNEKG